MPQGKRERAPTHRESQKLMAQANSKTRDLPEQVANRLDCVSHGLGIAGTVG